jgi:hypothetical protein
LLENPGGQSFAPTFATQLLKFLACDGTQAWPAPQVLEERASQRRPLDTLVVRMELAAQDVGAT